MVAKKKTTAKRKTATKKRVTSKSVAKKAPIRKAAVKKPTAKKAPARKAAVKKSTAKRAVKKSVSKRAAPKAAVATKRIKAIAEPMSRTAIYTQIAENTDLSRKDVAAVFEELGNIIDGHIRKRGAGQFTLPGLLKVTAVKKPARRARKWISPFTGEEGVLKGKPAQTVVKVRPLKKLKDFANN